MASRLLRFDGRVAVITGAGAGLGRAYALLFGSRGAKVVVNDLGGNPKGEGSDGRTADKVVQEIRNSGGTAVPDYNSVEDGEKIIKTALDTYGRVDIVVNNAGILRDKSFARTSDMDWDLVHRVHLRGSFQVSRAAWPHMRDQKFGRIIMTSSVAGIYGNFGQANYSAAKLGLVGLSNTLAVEGEKYGIHCNTVVPMGGTRLTEGILPPDLFNELKPELVAPLVMWLCHDDCQDSGGLFEAAGGWFGKYRWERSQGEICRSSLKELTTPENVRDNWEKISDFKDSLHPSSNGEAAGLLAGVLEELRDRVPSAPAGSGTKTGPLSAVGYCQKASNFTYDSRDVILYALGVGVSTKDEGHLKFLFEGNQDFTPLPTFVIVPAQDAMFNGFLFSGGIPGWSFDMTKILHGEQYIEMVKPLPSSGTLSSQLTVTDVLDKGSGAVMIVDVVTKDSSGDIVAKLQWSVFVVGEGGFGGPRTSAKTAPLFDAPKRRPDVVAEYKTSVDQAALYRLSGDPNPLHIDPDFAAMGGFSQPILHGLCSYGIAVRMVMKQFAANNVNLIKAMKARFAKPVLPGQTLVTEMWREGNRIHFQCNVKETGQVCMTGGYVDLFATAKL